MKKVFAVILAAILMSVWAAGCFAEAERKATDDLCSYIRDMWLDEEQGWYQSYFSDLGPYRKVAAQSSQEEDCEIQFFLDNGSILLSTKHKNGINTSYCWDGVDAVDLITLCGEMCRTWKDYEERGTLEMLVIYLAKNMVVRVTDEESAAAFMKMQIGDFRADRYEKEAKGLCGYILNEWLDRLSPYYSSYFSKHDPFVRKKIKMPGDDICGVIFVLDNGIIDLLGTDADGNGIEFEWKGFEANDQIFICAGMCLNWKQYEERGKLKIMLTYAEKDASMMIQDEESVRDFMNLFGELYPEVKAMIDAAATE